MWRIGSFLPFPTITCSFPLYALTSESLNILSQMMSGPSVKEPCLTIFQSWRSNHSLHLVVATTCIMYKRTICRCIALKINIKSVIALVNGVTIFLTQLALWTKNRDNMVSLSSTTKWISSWSRSIFVLRKIESIVVCFDAVIFVLRGCNICINKITCRYCILETQSLLMSKKNTMD